MHYHVSNEDTIVVLYNILPKGLWNQQLFMTILHKVQYPLRGFLKMWPLALFLGLCQHLLDFLVIYLGFEELLNLSLEK